MKEFKKLLEWPTYIICSDGTLYRDTEDGLVLSKLPVANNGYRLAQIYCPKKKRTFSYSFQSLMMKYFGPPKPEGDYLISHRNNNKLDCNIENLFWCHRKDILTGHRIPIEIYDSITGELSVWPNMSAAATKYKTNNVNLRRLINGDKVRGRNHLKIREI